MGELGHGGESNNDSTIQFAYETVMKPISLCLKFPSCREEIFQPIFPEILLIPLLVNETFVKKAGWKNPIGQQVNFWYNNKKYTVIGW